MPGHFGSKFSCNQGLQENQNLVEFDIKAKSPEFVNQYIK